MQIRDYWLILRKRWWIILVVALAASASSYLYCRAQTPVYQTTVRLLVQPARTDLGLAEATNRLLRQYSLFLQTEALASTVGERLKLDLDPGVLQSKVTAVAVPEDFALVLQVTDTDPQRAQNIAYVLADEFAQDQAVRMATQDPRDRVDVVMMNRPGAAELISPKTKTTVLAGTLFGLLLGCLLVVAVEILDDTLKTPYDVERWAKLADAGKHSPPAAGRVRQIHQARAG